jgi:chromosome partitioning protein
VLTIAFFNQKGGVGKTTTAVNAAACLAALGRRVLLVDLDYQTAATRWLEAPDDPARSVEAVLNGSLSLEDAAMPSTIAGVEIIPSTKHLSDFEVGFIGDPGAALALDEAFRAATSDRWDVALLDCCNKPDIFTVNALTAASHLVVPVDAQFMAVDVFEGLFLTVGKIQKRLNKGLAVTGILVTKFDAKTLESNQSLSDLRGAFGALVFDTTIRSTTRIARAARFGKPIITYDARSKGAEDYRSFTAELLARCEQGAAAAAEA